MKYLIRLKSELSEINEDTDFLFRTPRFNWRMYHPKYFDGRDGIISYRLANYVYQFGSLSQLILYLKMYVDISTDSLVEICECLALNIRFEKYKKLRILLSVIDYIHIDDLNCIISECLIHEPRYLKLFIPYVLKWYNNKKSIIIYSTGTYDFIDRLDLDIEYSTEFVTRMNPETIKAFKRLYRQLK